MRREDERLLETAEPRGDPPEPRHPNVRLPVDGDEEVAPRLDAEAAKSVGPLARDWRESHRGIGHDIPDDHGGPRHALGDEDLARALVGREEELRDPVDLDPVPLLRHLEVAAPQSGLDVRDRGARA